ncbi:MAG TPA: DNA cytosine methyltransferase [Chloroflexota bacterium]|nr:DNA cytosine methyltransferase [Chloroflexota bacterium]
MRVLIACEFSGIVRDAFLARGHDCWSCDLLPTERPGPHVQADVLTILGDGWDLLIAHPRCTYLCRMSYCRGDPDERKVADALAFVQALWAAPIARIALENPDGRLPRLWMPASQWIQPTMFGHPFTKKTGLWLKGVPPLMATSMIFTRRQWVHSGSGVKRGPAGNAKARARSFPGIADAMATQWSLEETP